MGNLCFKSSNQTSTSTNPSRHEAPQHDDPQGLDLRYGNAFALEQLSQEIPEVDTFDLGQNAPQPVRSSSLDTQTHQPWMPLSALPEEERWRLYIDMKDHENAQDKGHNGFLYDTQQSKGYQQAMERMFQENVLNPPEVPFREMDAERYHELHAEHVQGVTSNDRPIPTRWSGTNAQGGATNFPGKGVTEEALEEMSKEGLLRKGYPGKSTSFLMMNRIYVDYTQEEAPELVNRDFDTFREDLKGAESLQEHGEKENAKLGAICKLIRSLHVGHFFQDANGRLNCMLMLQGLLQESGLGAVLIEDPGIFGGQMTIEELIGELKTGRNRFGDLVDKTVPKPSKEEE